MATNALSKSFLIPTETRTLKWTEYGYRFILLIFFIVTTSFVKEQGLLISRPNKSSNPDSNKPVIMVQISETGLVNFNGKVVDIERLPARIENFLAKNETSSAVVIPHQNATYDKVVKVIDQIKLFSGLTVAIGK